MNQPNESPQPKPRRRLTTEEIEARIRGILILTLASVLGLSVISILYGLLFVYQPMEQSPNDAAFINILEPLMFSIGGALTGLAAGGAIRRNKEE